MNNIFAENLLHVRKLLGLSQSAIANIVGKTTSSIGNWESARSEPSLSDLIILTEKFMISMDYLTKRPLKGYNKREILELQRDTLNAVNSIIVIKNLKKRLSDIQEMLDTIETNN